MYVKRHDTTYKPTGLLVEQVLPYMITVVQYCKLSALKKWSNDCVDLDFR